MDLEQELTALLSRYLSPPIAKGLLRRSKERLGFGVLQGDMPSTLIESLQRATKPFLSPESHQKISSELGALGATSSVQRVLIQKEDDIVTARNIAKKLALQFGGSNFSAQRVSTAVSELARNIVNYTPGGSIVLGRVEGQKRLLIVAQDSGKGIPALPEILAGRYKSRTGLGLGILGVKRLAARFEVRSDSNGSVIEAEIDL